MPANPSQTLHKALLISSPDPKGSMKNERAIQYKILCRINFIVLEYHAVYSFQSNRTVSLGGKRLDISLLICEAATILVM